MRWVFKLRFQKERYFNKLIAAAPGTHRAAVEVIQRYCNKNARLLDFGCYEGAMIARLHDAGFAEVEGTDLTSHFSNAAFPFTQADLNLSFSREFGGKEYDALMVSEVIEHLDNPRHFLSECRAILKEGGIVVVTTPNIAFFEGRIKFLLTGELWGFGKKNYASQRHITAISREQFGLLFEECGYRVLSIFTAASFATPLRRILTSFIWIPMRFLFGKSVLGESLIVVGTKKSNENSAYSSQSLWGEAALKIR